MVIDVMVIVKEKVKQESRQTLLRSIVIIRAIKVMVMFIKKVMVIRFMKVMVKGNVKEGSRPMKLSLCLLLTTSIDALNNTFKLKAPSSFSL